MIKESKILLIYPPITKKYAPHPMDIPVPHIGIAYIAALLKKNGYDVMIKDCPAEEIELSELFSFFENNEFNIIGISTYYFNINSVIRIVSRLKDEGKFLFVGGMLPTLSPQNVLRTLKGIDCCVLGEGELTNLELITAVDSKKNWRIIDGIAYIGEEGEIIITKKRKLIENLDDLPFPLRIKPKREYYTPVLASRGCYGNCNFCSIESYFQTCIGKKVRIRNPICVVDEIEQLVLQGHKYIKFNDENFNFSSEKGKRWFVSFYSEIKERKINAKYIMDMRVNEVINGKEEIKKFSEIGLDFIFIGVESFIQKHLDFFNKKVRVEDNILAMHILDELGINYRIGLLIFNPVTTMEDVKKSLEIIKKVYYLREENMMKPVSLFQPLVAVSGTPIYDYVIERKLYRSNDRGYIFEDRKVEEYYQIIKRWSKFVNAIYEKRFLDNEKSLPKRLFHLLYKIDLHFMMNVLKDVESSIKRDKLYYESCIENAKKQIDNLYEEGK